jgi:uncharacterized ferritin-like protein (DUF455 family)
MATKESGMRRFISHLELARDNRFIRQNAITDIMAQMPDDVDTVVEAFDMLTPMIEATVKDSPFEALFDAYGPAFMLTILNEPIKADDPYSRLRLQVRMHGIFMGEMQALEGAGRTLWDFPDAPWEFKMNMARQCWDEARHVQIYEKLLTHVGGHVGMVPENTFLFEAACADDPVLRVAGVNRGLEGLACDVFRDMINYAEQTGDAVLKQAVDYVLADELTHVRFGSEWVREFTKDDPQRASAAKEFQREVDRRFSVGGTRSGRQDATIPVSADDRREAGFTENEIEELLEISNQGPSRETLRKAAEILRQRHCARRKAAQTAA